MVSLTTLAPDIVEAVLDETLPPTLFNLAVDPLPVWEEQRGRIGLTTLINRALEV